MRPDRVAFLPTGQARDFVRGFGLELLGVTTLEGKPCEYDLEPLACLPDEDFDRAIAELVRARGGLLWTVDEAQLWFGRGRPGQVGASWFKTSLWRVTTEVPWQTPSSLFDRWSAWQKVVTPADQRRFGLLTLGISAPLLPVVGGFLWGALTSDPLYWFGVAFWSLLPALFGTLWLLQWRVVGRPAGPARPALELWPAPPAVALGQSAPAKADPFRSAHDVAEPLPKRERPRLTMALAIRGILGGFDLLLAALAFSAVASVLASAIGPKGGPWAFALIFPAVFGYHAAALHWLGSTLGQWLLGVRTVAADGGRPSFGRLAVRVAFIWGEVVVLTACSIFAFAGLWAYAVRRGGLPHDELSGTRLTWR